MRSPQDRELALRCLNLAHSHGPEPVENIVARAEAFFAFVTGDDAAEMLSKVREALAT